MTTITVAIPTYNQAASIQRAIDSVLAQDVAELEVMIYDDSPDEDYSLAVSKYAQLPNFTYKKNSTTLGMARNYKQGLASAKGEFFLNLDGDDYLTDPKFLRKATDLLRKHPNSVVAIGGQSICDSHGKQLKIQEQTKKSFEIIDGMTFFSLSLSDAAPVIPHLATVVRTDVARSIEYYTADLINTDLHSVRRLFLKGDVILIDNICGTWSYNDSNASMNFSPVEHSRNVFSLVDPFEVGMALVEDDAARAHSLTEQFRKGLRKYHNDIYAICLRSDRPIRNMLEYQRCARRLTYSGRWGIKGRMLWPGGRILRNLMIRVLLGRRSYQKLANRSARQRNRIGTI